MAHHETLAEQAHVTAVTVGTGSGEVAITYALLAIYELLRERLPESGASMLFKPYE